MFCVGVDDVSELEVVDELLSDFVDSEEEFSVSDVMKFSLLVFSLFSEVVFEFVSVVPFEESSVFCVRLDVAVFVVLE